MKAVLYVAAIAFASFAIFSVIKTVSTEAEAKLNAAPEGLSSLYVVDVLWAKIHCTDIRFGVFEPVTICDTSLVSTDDLRFNSKEIVKLRNVAEYVGHARPADGFEPIRVRYRVKPKKHEEEISEQPEPGIEE